MLVEAMDPIAQGLTIHTANARGFFTIHSIVNRRYGK
jgi:hypothetical protein